MRLLWSRTVYGLRVTIFLRLHVPVIRLAHILIFRLLHRSILGLRSSLLLVDARLSLRHLPDLTASAIGLREGTEAVLRLLRRLGPLFARHPLRVKIECRNRSSRHRMRRRLMSAF